MVHTSLSGFQVVELRLWQNLLDDCCFRFLVVCEMLGWGGIRVLFFGDCWWEIISYVHCFCGYIIYQIRGFPKWPLYCLLSITLCLLGLPPSSFLLWGDGGGTSPFYHFWFGCLSWGEGRGLSYWARILLRNSDIVHFFNILCSLPPSKGPLLFLFLKGRNPLESYILWLPGLEWENEHPGSYT